MTFISCLKKLPIDVGQAEKSHNTAGKRIAFSLVPEGDGKVALDVGCRNGYWSGRLKEKGYHVFALDIEPLHPDALKHDVEKGLPFSDSSFDLIWCTEVIEHLRNPEFLIREVERVLKQGGTAVLTTPNSNWWFYWVVRLWGWTPAYLQNPDHKQFFNEKGIRKLASGYNLFGYFPYALFFMRLERFIGALAPTFIFVRKKA